MVANTRALLLQLFIATVTVAYFARVGLAHHHSLPQPPSSMPPPPPPSGFPGLAPLPSLDCWNRLRGIGDCVWRIFDFLFTGNPGLLGKECCTAVVHISEDCWPSMFPLQPHFGALLKKKCHEIIGKP